MRTVRDILGRSAAVAALHTDVDKVGAGVRVAIRHTLTIATLMMRRNAGHSLARRVRDLFELEMPQGPRRVFARNVAILGVGPGAWLVVGEGRGDVVAASLAASLREVASVTEQTDAYVVFRLGGPSVRDSLCRLIQIDVHPSAFTVGDVAATFAAEIATTLWRLEDQEDGSPVFEVAVPRSTVGSFCEALIEAAAQFGVAAG